MDKLYTVEKAAEFLSIHPDTLRLWLRTGKIQGVKLGRVWRIPEAEIKALIEKTPNS